MPTSTEQKWRAKDDAQALMRAEEIKMDNTRLKRALAETRRIATEAEKAIAITKKTSRKRPRSSQNKKRKKAK